MTKADQDYLEVVEEDRDVYRLRWWLPEVDDYGATVGENGKAPSPRKKGDDIEWYTAEVVCFKLFKVLPDSNTFGLDSNGFWWASKALANKVLSQIRAETKVSLQANGESRAEWPEWAITAKANGWKPPKGWTP